MTRVRIPLRETTRNAGTVNDFGAGKIRDETLLFARILLVMLFAVFGWGKLTGHSGTVTMMTHYGLPMPAAAVAIVMEFFVPIAIIIGAWTRPLAVLLGLYMIATAFVGHPYWGMTGAEQM